MRWDERMLDFLTSYRQYFFIIIALVIARIVLIQVYKRRKGLKKKDNFVIGINNMSWLIAGVWLFLFTLHILGITVREFFTSIAIIAAALAIVFRDYIVNGLNGMLIMFGDNYRIGDYIEIADQKGRIEDVTLLNVHLKNDEDNLVIIPNNQMVATIVTNYSKNPKIFSSIDFELRSANAISFERLEKRLFKVLVPYEPVLRNDSQQLRMVEYKQDIIHYRLSFGLKKYEHSTAREIKQLLYRELLHLVEVDKKTNNENS